MIHGSGRSGASTLYERSEYSTSTRAECERSEHEAKVLTVYAIWSLNVKFYAIWNLNVKFNAIWSVNVKFRRK